MASIPESADRLRNLDGEIPRPACGRPDAVVPLIVGVLMALGVVMVYSASATIDGAGLNWRQWWATPLRQGVFAAAGFAALLFAANLDYRLFLWERRSDAWWAAAPAIAAAALLLVVLVPGVGAARLGAQRALVLMSSPIPISFQPSELAKIALVVWLAALLTSRSGSERFPLASLRRGYGPAIGSALPLVGLTGIEDFGTAALMGAVALAMLFAAGARLLHLGLTALLGLAGGAVLIWLKPYRFQRLLTFISENPDPAADGYQVTQSLIAIGSGGWWGRGLGAGVQKYGYLPQDNNDFIFAVVCEELGVAGGLTVCLLFLLLLWRGWSIARSAAEPFGRLLAAGITLMICLQAALNVGVVTNSVPTKGISLPFVSAGGSGVVFLGLAAGLLASVGRGRGARATRADASRRPG